MMVMRVSRKTPFRLIDIAGQRIKPLGPVALDISVWGIVEVFFNADGTSGFFVPTGHIGSTTVTFAAHVENEDGTVEFLTRVHDIEVVRDEDGVLKVAIDTPVPL